MLTATVPDYKPGDLLPGTKYRVVRPLAAGAMGVLFEVVKEPDIRGVAKLLSGAYLMDGRFRRRFMEEARILAQLDHPNIVKIFDYDTLESGAPFFVMEVLRGKALDEVLADRKTLPPRICYRVMRELLSALHCAHTHRTPVVHRDVKPANIFLHKPGNGDSLVKLIDFGVMAAPNKQTLIAGTPGYMAPEQFTGHTLDARTDVYASAVVLYEMLTGHGPFGLHEGLGVEALSRATKVVPADQIGRHAAWLPESVASAIASALDKDPDKRPASAKAFLEALSELDRADLLGDDAPFEWPREESSPRVMTVASFTAAIGTPTADPVAPKPPLAPTEPRKGGRSSDTLTSHEVDTFARKKREERARSLRWVAIGGLGTLLILGAGVGIGLAWRAVSTPSPSAGLVTTPPPIEKNGTQASPLASTAPVAVEEPPVPAPASAPAPPAPLAASARAPSASAATPRPPKPNGPTRPTSSGSPRPGPTFEPSIGD